MNISIDATQLIATAQQLGAAGAAATVRATKVVAKTAYDMQSSGQAFAPVDTGYLRSSITTSISGLTAQIGPTASYGYFVEAGTSRMAPQPYMGPAFDRHLPSFIQAMEQVGANPFGVS